MERLYAAHGMGRHGTVVQLYSARGMGSSGQQHGRMASLPPLGQQRMSAGILIPRSVSVSRYTMPCISLKVEGTTKMIKSVITNIHEVGWARHPHSDQIRKSSGQTSVRSIALRELASYSAWQSYKTIVVMRLALVCRFARRLGVRPTTSSRT
jgi:hypothetical protein